jgi:hypothetical protein
MKIKLLALMVAGLSMFALAQGAQPGRGSAASSRVVTLDSTSGVDPQLHEEVLQLIDLSGARQDLEGRKAEMVEEGRKKMMEACPKCAPEFSTTWAKRMLERMNIEDFIHVYARAYEKYLGRDDVEELIELRKKALAHAPAQPSPRLRKKIESVMPTMMGDIMGDCVKIGAELGSQIAEEIATEHPEYVKNVPRN